MSGFHGATLARRLEDRKKISPLLNMKVVFLTDRCPMAGVLLRQITSSGITIHTIFVENPKLYRKLERSFRKCGIIGTSKVVLKRIMQKLGLKKVENWLNNDFYDAYSHRVCCVDDINGKQCEQLLKEIEPDIIALGCGRIIQRNIFNIPRLGTLNAHPGLLPDYRGLDPELWAIYNEDLLGATVHYIDEGVDTGPIIVRKVVTIEENDTIDILKNKLRVMAGNLMADTIKRLAQGEDVSISPQPIEAGHTYHAMPARKRRETLQKFARMTRRVTV